MACLHAEGRLPRGEHNILGEAFLIIASAAGYLCPLTHSLIFGDFASSLLLLSAD